MNSPKSIFTVPRSFLSQEANQNIQPPQQPPLRRQSTPDHRIRPGKGGLGTTVGGSRTSGSEATDFGCKAETQDHTVWSSERSSKRPTLHHRSTSVPDVNDALREPAKASGGIVKKRLFTDIAATDPHQTKEIPRKKSRFCRPRHTLDPSFFARGPVANGSPPSPLFFSHSPRRRPVLPPRFSSSEAGATMLSKTQAEDNGSVKTVKLPRGAFNSSSPPRALSTPGGRGSGDRPSISRGVTPDSGEKSTGLQVLSQVGIIELLEQDERPTFIIDLGNTANFSPGPLQITFANVSLRTYAGLLEIITGSAAQNSPGSAVSTSFSEFKAWAVSFVKNQESLDVCLPSFLFGDITWTCSTLRKRLRLISGNYKTGTMSFGSNPPSVGFPSVSTVLSERSRRSTDLENMPLQVGPEKRIEEEAPDYFGAVSAGIPPSNSSSSKGTRDGIMSTTEYPDPSNKHADGGTTAAPPFLGSDAASSLSSNPSLANEAMLGAASAGHVDGFYTTNKSADQGFFDWTRLPMSLTLPHHVQFARSVDWASTSLGPIEGWPAALRGMCNLIMASPHPAAMYWGDDLVAIYNEAYILLAGQKHPSLMGQSYKDAWAEIWGEVSGVFASAKMTGEATMKDDDCLFMNRSGFLEETYFSWSIIPLVGEDGSVVGLYNPAFEKTRRKIAERRMLTLREVGERTAAAREIGSFWGQVLKALEINEYDTPFAMLYSVSDEAESDASSMHSNSLLGTKQCILEGSLGVPEGHPAAPAELDLKSSAEGFGPIFRDAMKSDRPIVLETDKGTLSTEMLDGIKWRGFGDPCKAAVVCPIHPTTGWDGSILGFLVMGINPRRPYDDDYNLFVQLLSRQLATSMASVVLFEEEIRRGQRAAKLAALDRIELSEQLAIRTQEAVESETKFTRMAEFAPVGMFIANSEGRITYCNDTWYEISRHPKEENSTDYWMDSVKDEDKTIVKQMWTNVVEHKVAGNAEFRYKTPWRDRNGVKGDTWVLASAYPEKAEDGSLKSVFGSITNISQQKWAEDVQKRRMEEAVELKRQQENFIDITSHEMRNPLSAILQCADEVSTSLMEFRSNQDKTATLSAELVDSNIDAAQTILLCAQHQKRIVDDVLTLSKLDSALLLVTPVDVQPVAVVQRALKMFEGELETNDIDMKFRVDDSFTSLNVQWVRVDPSRLLQVLINLTTNAIKFTTTERKRTITVTLSASLQRPTKASGQVSYFPSRSKRKDSTSSEDWGDGEKVFLHFAVKDTGRGLSESEKKLLFIRFSQASPRTHVQYGGSGLGLFISRELTELQGGEIGVASESGKGSTFAFYVKARRSSVPKDAVEQLPAAPVKKISMGKNRQEHAAQPAKSSPVTSNPENSMRKDPLKVLIVEDNLVNQRVLQKQLRNLGCIVHVANHGGEALEKLKESTFWEGHGENAFDLSVILMDQEMPVMDGLTCTRRIRELQKEEQIVRHVPIIAVTANARSAQISTAIAAGMDDVVSKPFRIPELIPKIEGLLTRLQN